MIKYPLPTPVHLGWLFTSTNSRRTFRLEFDSSSPIFPELGNGATMPAIEREIARLAMSLDRRGFQKNDHVLIVKSNHIDIQFIATAVARLEALPLVTTTKLHGDALASLVNKFEPRWVLCDSSGERTLEQIQADSLPGATVLNLEDDATVCFGNDPDITNHNIYRSAPKSWNPDSPAICTHTSGTTGSPKIIVHSHRSLLSGQALMESLPWGFWTASSRDRKALCVSFAHARSYAWMAGTIRVPPSAALFLSDATSLTAESSLDRFSPTMIEAHPADFHAWARNDSLSDSIFARVRFFLSTFDAVHPSTIRTLLNASKKRFPIWAQGWAQSEVGPIAVGFYSRRSVARVSLSSRANVLGGLCTFGTKIRIVGPKPKGHGNGQTGLVEVVHPGQCLDYLGEHERYLMKKDGAWWNTGDIGQVRMPGAVKFYDRDVDGGQLDSCIALESFLLSALPQLEDVVILTMSDGLPIPVLIDSPDTTIDDLIAVLPRSINLADPVHVQASQVPVTSTGKVIRSALRQSLFGNSASFNAGKWV